MRCLPFVAAAVLVVATQTTAAQTSAYRVDASKSHATIHVGKSGVFSFMAGHTHEVEGPIAAGSVDVDPVSPDRSRIRLTIATSDLEVLAAHEPKGDAPKVQEAMDGDKVLDVAHYPQITYESTGVTLESRHGHVLELVVTGQLTIRDISQPVTAPVRVELGDRTLTASGRLTIKQSAFGIKPISVGGVVAVKDTLDIDFSVSAAS